MTALTHYPNYVSGIVAIMAGLLSLIYFSNAKLEKLAKITLLSLPICLFGMGISIFWNIGKEMMV